MCDAGTWLTRQGCERVRDELNRLLLGYRSAEYHHKDHDGPEARDQREWQERRIRQLQELPRWDYTTLLVVSSTFGLILLIAGSVSGALTFAVVTELIWAVWRAT